MESFPLYWPHYRPRTRIPGHSKFKTRQWESTKALAAELGRLRASNIVISTNVELRNDGLPYANRRAPEDKGVAVYFTRRGKALCFACDKWDTVGDNIHAITKTIDSLRAIERWGTGDMMEQAFDGFLALPAPRAPVHERWWAVFNLNEQASNENVIAAYKSMAKIYHPDAGGAADKFARIGAAYADFKKERGL